MSEISCVVCYRDVQYFSVGSCDHSVCYECSARMRVLLQQNECPICRKTLEKVVFSRGIKLYQELESKLTKFIYRPQHGIYLESDEIERQLENLLEHRCNFCPDHPYFNTFDLLKTHVQRTHDLFCCDLCTEHIKHFSKERRFYSRSDLAYHKRKGDKNDKSHRGHPLCQFCDRRYFDSDELFKHLRVDHYYCHFCDADGLNFFYNGYEELRVHFRCEHFLCEEENCKDEKFTSVFRTEIDLKVHLTTAHSKMLGKHGTKQARIVDVQFSMAPRPADDRRTRRFNTGNRFGRERDGTEKESEESKLFAHVELPQPVPKPPPVEINTDSAKDFPSLGGADATLPINGVPGTASIAQRVALSSGMNVSSGSSQISSRDTSCSGSRSKWNAKVTGSSRMEEEFPALGESSSKKTSAPTAPSAASLQATYYSQQRQGPSPANIASNASVQPGSKSGKSINNNRPQKSAEPVEDFPSLGNPISSKNVWAGSSVKMKQKSKMEKVASAPVLSGDTPRGKVNVQEQDFQYVPLSVTKRRDPSFQHKMVSTQEDSNYPILIDKSPEESTKKSKDGKSDNSVAKAAAAIFNGSSSYASANGYKKTKSTNCKNKTPAMTSEDFPSLPSSSLKRNKDKTLPELESLNISEGDGSKLTSSVPPGFESNVAGFNMVAPPPGFSVPTLPNNSYDFFSTENGNDKSQKASGDFRAVLDAVVSPDSVYIQPMSFTQRNQCLFESVSSSLNSDSGSCELFRTMSNQYRKGEITSKEYYELCQDMLGTYDFRVIFPELLALLPNIQRQQELLVVHRNAGGGTNGLISCTMCYQVVKSGEISSHMRSHSGEDVFPALRR